MVSVVGADPGGKLVFGAVHEQGRPLTKLPLDIRGTIKFTDDTDYWQANSFPFVFQNVTTFFKLGGDDVFIYGGVYFLLGAPTSRCLAFVWLDKGRQQGRLGRIQDSLGEGGRGDTAVNRDTLVFEWRRKAAKGSEGPRRGQPTLCAAPPPLKVPHTTIPCVLSQQELGVMFAAIVTCLDYSPILFHHTASASRLPAPFRNPHPPSHNIDFMHKIF